MAKKGTQGPEYVRLNARVALDVAARLDEARAALKREGVWVSASNFVEIALLELLAKRDLSSVLRKHGATARRDLKQ